MTISGVLLTIAVLCIAWATASAMLITRMLDRRGLNTPLPLIGLFQFRNLERYGEITRRETGKVGFLFLFVCHSNQCRARPGFGRPGFQKFREMSVLMPHIVIGM
jgi:hypothetical protein